jgi:acetyl-CoA carboxylase biotin carboxyl carrier protein
VETGQSGAAQPPLAPQSNEHIVKSPIVGTFYESPKPGDAAFVKVGDVVEAGQVLCIIESMKLMNEIESEIAGTVVAKLMESGRPVEYGEALFAIRPR